MKPRARTWRRNLQRVVIRTFTHFSSASRPGRKPDCRSNLNNMTPENANEVLSAWETSSQYWNKHQALIEHMYSPLSRVLLEEAGIGPGNNVLDVGGGSGEPSLSIAAAVGELGSVFYTD